MKRFLWVSLCLVMALALCACGKQEQTDEPAKIDVQPPVSDAVQPCSGAVRDLWDRAAPETSALTLYCYDGTEGWSKMLFEQDAVTALLARWKAVEAVPVTGWTPKELRFPVYAVEIGSRDGDGLRMAWSAGYLIDQYGGVYQFDYDFSTVNTTNWREGLEPSSPAQLPCGYYLSRDAAQYYPALLTPAEAPEPPEGVTAALTEHSGGRLTVELNNRADGQWLYGTDYAIQALLDGVWYELPMLPDVNRGFTAIAIVLLPGAHRTEVYPLAAYGGLLPGQYRLVISGLLPVEFSVE